MQQIAKPLGEIHNDRVQQEKVESNKMAIEPPDVNDKRDEDEEKPGEQQVAEPPPAEEDDKAERKSAEANEHVLPVPGENVVKDRKSAVINNVDENGNGADAADLPVHRGVKEDPANAIENAQGDANNNDDDDDHEAEDDDDAEGGL